MRSEHPVKDLRRAPTDDGGENDDSSLVPGATGGAAGRNRRPGRAASLPSTSPRARSSRRRQPGAKTHASTPRDNPAKSARSAPKNPRRTR